jgi:quercetin dioxygenase-like cupin family protein
MGRGGPFSFLGSGCPGECSVRTVVLQPNETLMYHAPDWDDSLVVVTHGVLEVECWTGARAGFHEGAVLVFAGLELRCLRNPGTSPLVLSGLSRVER